MTTDRSSRRNRGRAAVPSTAVATAVSAAMARLAHRHPSVGQTVLREAVHQAAVELVNTATDPDGFASQLERRVHARLLAMAGAPLAIRRRHSGPTAEPFAGRSR
jgi:hypothetical protein